MADNATPTETPTSTPATPGTPPVVPAEPPVPTATATAPEPAEAAPEKWESTGDSLVDTLAAGYIAKGGSVEAFRALLEDVGSTGALTEHARVELRKTFGDMAEALIPSIEAKAKANLEWVTEQRNAIFSAVGGETEFTKMQAWARDNLDDATRAYLTSGLNLGGNAALAAVAQIKNLMIQKGATVTDATHTPEGSPAGAGETLTRAAYISERAKLERAGDRAGVEALQARARNALAAANKRGHQWR